MNYFHMWSMRVGAYMCHLCVCVLVKILGSHEHQKTGTYFFPKNSLVLLGTSTFKQQSRHPIQSMNCKLFRLWTVLNKTYLKAVILQGSLIT